jgi:hypothetical protein
VLKDTNQIEDPFDSYQNDDNDGSKLVFGGIGRVEVSATLEGYKPLLCQVKVQIFPINTRSKRNSKTLVTEIPCALRLSDCQFFQSQGFKSF